MTTKLLYASPPRITSDWKYQIMWEAEGTIWDDDIAPFPYEVGMELLLAFEHVHFTVKVEEIARYPLDARIMLYCDTVSVDR